MKDDPSLNNITVMENVNATWERVNCSLITACTYNGSPSMQQPGPQQQRPDNFIRPSSCQGISILIHSLPGCDRWLRCYGPWFWWLFYREVILSYVAIYILILLPAVSTEISTGQSPGQGRPRNKRSPGSLMPGGHGPGGAPAPGPSPQTANADANAYAKFLVKYMELDDITRQNIGHQVLETKWNYTG